ncbi:IS3 family transposase, partial [Eggerthella lenta]
MAYGKERKEEVLSRFHASGMSMRAACSSLEGFPSASTLSAFLRDEEAGLLRPPVLEVPGRCPDGRRPWEPYPLETKREAVKLLADGLGPAAAARRLN